MQGLVAEAMRTGRGRRVELAGVRPGAVREHQELIALARAAAQFGGIYATHMRSERESIWPRSRRRSASAARPHIPVEIWHLKAGRQGQLGLMPEIVARIERRAPPGSTSPPTPMRIPPGTTTCRRSFRPGRTTAATRS